LTVVFSFDVWCSPEIAVCIIAHPMAWNADRMRQLICKMEGRRDSASDNIGLYSSRRQHIDYRSGTHTQR